MLSVLTDILRSSQFILLRSTNKRQLTLHTSNSI